MMNDEINAIMAPLNDLKVGFQGFLLVDGHFANWWRCRANTIFNNQFSLKNQMNIHMSLMKLQMLHGQNLVITMTNFIAK